MLQYFTGSKNHNIKLRNFALERGLSLNEYGIKRIATGKLLKFATEESFYNYLNLKFIPPELREDKGEIERAAEGKLPRLINTRDLNGDLHIHTSYDIASAHDIGIHSLVEHLSKAAELGYEYIGISDHNPSVSKHSEKEIVEIMRKRQFYYQKQHEGWMAKNDREVKHGAKTQLFIMCEVDIAPDGKLALPVSAMEYVDAVIVSLHSSFRLERREMTDRVTQALASHPKVRIYGHPTGRLLGRREGVELDWDEIFTVCRQNDIALEINANPERLDLPDSIVYDAVAAGIKCCINSDAHAIEQMDLARYGISVARRGWAVKSDIVNTLDNNKFAKWLIK